MNAPRLSTAMRNVLHAAIHGGLSAAKLRNHATRQSIAALQQRGLLDAQHKATPSGRALFYPDAQRPCQVWHLIGAQGTGKGVWARAEVRALAAKGLTACLMDVVSFEKLYAANPARVIDDLGPIHVLMLESNRDLTGTPPHCMAGDRVLRFPTAASRKLVADLVAASEAETRRPGITALYDQLRAWYPQWSEERLVEAAKGMWTRAPDAPALQRLLAEYTRQKGLRPRMEHAALLKACLTILHAEGLAC